MTSLRTQDSLMLLGASDQGLIKLFTKLRYRLVLPDDKLSVPQMLRSNPVDLILVDARDGESCTELCAFLRADETSKRVPLVVLVENSSQQLELERCKFSNIQIMRKDESVGLLAVRVATELRLRKMAGEEDGHAGLAEVNATLRDLNAQFKKEREEARKIQTSLLPSSLPRTDKYEIAAWYQPLEDVGGDWYFLETLDDNKVAIQVADVTGHGMAAALLASMTKLALHACSSRNPSELLQSMNKLLSPELPEGRFVTISSCLFDPTTGALEFARAGLPPALIFDRKAGKVRELKSRGFALGFVDDAEFVSVSDELKPDEILVVFTDGLTEAKNRGNQLFGMQRIVDALLGSKSNAGADQAMNALRAAFENFIDGRKLKDDVTVVMVRRL